MPIDYKNYPDNWKTEIRPAVLIRAGGDPENPVIGARCESCGVPNYAVGYWYDTGFIYEETEVCKSYKSAKSKADYCNLIIWEIKTIVIVLTISHTNHDITNNDMENLKALCQRCHNRHDAKYRAMNRKKNKGQMVLL